MTRNLLATLIVALIWIMFSCGSATEEKTKSAAPPLSTDIKEFIELKCTMCHFTDRIYKDKHQPQQWRRIVKRMRNRNPEWISREEANNILNYLIKNNSLSESE